MTLKEAIQLSPEIRRASWPKDQYRRFYNAKANPGAILISLSYEDLVAEDWEVFKQP